LSRHTLKILLDKTRTNCFSDLSLFGIFFCHCRYTMEGELSNEFEGVPKKQRDNRETKSIVLTGAQKSVLHPIVASLGQPLATEMPTDTSFSLRVALHQRQTRAVKMLDGSTMDMESERNNADCRMPVWRASVFWHGLTVSPEDRQDTDG
jgi:hypothetical protein